MRSPRNLLECSEAVQDSLVNAARSKEVVSGLTHTYYKYPARFSPALVRAAIQAFSKPGDLVLDPFMGGGTTLVEALALGRHGLGTDISSLATFISKTKTTLYSEKELNKLWDWARQAPAKVHMTRKGKTDAKYKEAGYYRHMNNASTWRLRKTIEQLLSAASKLPTKKLERFARCVILRTAQWALDGRKSLPSINNFREALVRHAEEMIAGARALRISKQSNESGEKLQVKCLNRSSVGFENERLVKAIKRPKLVVTSPPYPGVHVLYHRWQVDGRKETPAPFWIANKLDGDGASYYTMGDRKSRELDDYFDNLRGALRSIASVCSKHTTIIQVVAFSEPNRQLSRYLSVADDMGLVEFFLPNLRNVGDGRLWRMVPNRKWHANRKGSTAASQEVVLFHRKKF